MERVARGAALSLGYLSRKGRSVVEVSAYGYAQTNMEYKEEDYAAFMQQYCLPEKYKAFVSTHTGELTFNKTLMMLKDRFTLEAFSEDMVSRAFIPLYLGDKKLLDWDFILMHLFCLGLEYVGSQDFGPRLSEFVNTLSKQWKCVVMHDTLPLSY